jgi:hypothetical protein
VPVSGFGATPSNNTTGFGTTPPSSNRPSFSSQRLSIASALSTAPPSFSAFRAQRPQASPAPHDDDPDSQLISVLSFYIPALEDIRILRSTVRKSALAKFVDSRNGTSDGYAYTDDEEETDSDDLV